MGTYAKAAIRAAKKLQSNSHLTPDSAWKGGSGCGKATFIGLANMGLIQGYPPGIAGVNKNGVYGVLAVWILKSVTLMLGRRALNKLNQTLVWNVIRKGLGRPTLSQNRQLEVVFALWRHNLIV